MKKKLLVAMSALTLASCSVDSLESQEVINSESNEKSLMRNNGLPNVEKTIEGDFNGITINQAIIGSIVKSDTEKVVISALENEIDYVNVTKTNGNLNISIKAPNGKSINGPVYATIYAKDLSVVTANSASSITLKNSFTEDNISFFANGAAKIDGNNVVVNNFNLTLTSSSQFSGKIKVKDVKISATGASRITISGIATTSNVVAQSASRVNGENLVSDNADLKAMSSSYIGQSVKSNANGYAVAASTIDIFKKTPTLNVNRTTFSAGRVNIK